MIGRWTLDVECSTLLRDRQVARVAAPIHLARFVLACAVALFAATTARAQDDHPARLPLPARSTNLASDASAARVARGTSSTSSWKTTGGALLFVAALVIVAAKVLRKGLPAAPASLPNEVVDVLGRKALDYKHTLHFVRCGSRLLLLGSSNEGLRTLGEISDAAEVEYLTGLCRPQEKGPVSAAAGDLWKRWRGEAGVGVAELESGDEAEFAEEARLRVAPHSEPATFPTVADAGGASNEESVA